MPLVHKYDLSADAFLVSASGTITDTDLRDGILRVLADKAFHPDVRIFEDFTQVDQFQMSRETVAELCSNDKVTSLRGRYAQLMFSPKGSMLLADSLSTPDSSRFRRFYKRQAALDWLNEGVSPSKAITLEASLPALPLANP